MGERDKQKGYIPWHDRINEPMIKELSSQFVEILYRHGVKVTDIKINWDEKGKFEFDTTGDIREDG